MNFLAHAFLSFKNEHLIVGNLIADMIKGKQIDLLPLHIQKGVLLHRAIDEYTDEHPIVRKTALLLESSAGRYSSSFLDIAFDYCLATNNLYTPKRGWEQFARQCYQAIETNHKDLPNKFIHMYMYMKNEDWLSNYHRLELIEKSFDRLQNRATYLEKDQPIFNDFLNNQDEIKESFNLFFPDLINFAKNKAGLLM